MKVDQNLPETEKLPAITKEPDTSEYGPVVTLPFGEPLDRILNNIGTRQAWCSWDAQSEKDQQKLALYKTYIGNDINKMKQDKGIEMANLVLSWQSYANDKGELIEGPCLLIVDSHGKSCRIVANYLIQQVLLFCHNMGGFPLKKPIQIKAVDAVLESGNRVYNLQLVD